MKEEVDDASNIRKWSVGRVDGKDALGISAGTDGSIYVWVAIDPPHHLLKLQQTGLEDRGTMTFTDHEQPVDTSPPPQAEYVDLYAEEV